MKLGQPVPESNLSSRAEERLAGGDVDVEAGLVVVPELVVERRLGGVVLRDLVLQRREPLAKLGVGRLFELARGHRGLLLLARRVFRAGRDSSARGSLGFRGGAVCGSRRSRCFSATAGEAGDLRKKREERENYQVSWQLGGHGI